MAGDPHIKTKCGNCGKSLTKQNATWNISKKEGMFIVHKTHCIECTKQYHKDNPVKNRSAT